MSRAHARLFICLMLAGSVLVPGLSTGFPSSDEVPEQVGCKDWTLLLYWDADNNLEFCTEFALATWEEALTSNEDVNVVAMVDILSENGTWIYEVNDGASEAIETMPEQDMSDSEVLKDFIVYGMSNFPAEKTILVLQDHGYSWRGLCVDDTDGGMIMTIDAMAEAIRDARAENDGRGVDILAMDACSMATVEIVYELRDTVPWFVASQSVVPYDGLPYDMMIRSLVEDPTMSAESFASLMVDQYLEYYSSKTDYEHIYPYDQDFITASAFDISLVDEMGEKFIELTETLEPLVATYPDEIKAARDLAVDGKWANIGGWEYLADAYTLFEELKGIDPSLDAAIDGFLEAFDAALVNEGDSWRFNDVPHGLVIHFPPILALYDSKSWGWAQQFVYHDIGLDIVDQSAWVSCLMEYYFAPPGTQSCPNL
ncbi:TPA: hypothetical protein HA259_06740 [Thermoplasmata archaeon]|nr:hypothetical protein [Thermoplasmata archaeon]